MGAVLRYILLSLAAAFVAMFAEPFFSELLRRFGIDTSQWVEPIVTLASQIWFQLLASGVVGATIGAWGHWALTKLERKPARPALPRPDTRLRLRLDHSGTRHYLEERQTNIYSWRQTIVSMQGVAGVGRDPLLHVDNLSVIFEQDIEYERPVLEAFGHALGGYNFFLLGTKGAVFQFVDRIQAPVVEIWFPPPGYYANRQANEAAVDQPQEPQEPQEPREPQGTPEVRQR